MQAYFLRSYGANPGKRVVGLAVVQSDKSRVDLLSAIIREYALYIDGILNGLVGLLAVVSSKNKQRLGDMWADTIVVRWDDITDDKKGTRIDLLIGLGIVIRFGALCGVADVLATLAAAMGL